MMNMSLWGLRSYTFTNTFCEVRNSGYDWQQQRDQPATQRGLTDTCGDAVHCTAAMNVAAECLTTPIQVRRRLVDGKSRSSQCRCCAGELPMVAKCPSPKRLVAACKPCSSAQLFRAVVTSVINPCRTMPTATPHADVRRYRSTRVRSRCACAGNHLAPSPRRHL